MKIISTNKIIKRAILNWSISPILILAIILFPGTAYAYVDPGSGSVIVTTILGLIAAIGYTFRKYFYKMKRLFKNSKSEDDTSDDR